MAYPRTQRSRAFKHVRRTSGNLILNNTAWTNLDTALDLVLSAQIGDVIEAAFSARWENEAFGVGIDVHSWVSGAAVTAWSSGVAPTGTGLGVRAWYGLGGVAYGVGGSVMNTLVAGDISAGTVTLRLRFRNAAAGNRTLYASADEPLQFSAKNLGPPAR